MKKSRKKGTSGVDGITGKCILEAVRNENKNENERMKMNNIDQLTKKAQAMVATATDEMLDTLWNIEDLDIRIRKIVSAEMTRRVEESITEQDILDEMGN